MWSILHLPAWRATLELGDGAEFVGDRMELHLPDGRVVVARAEGKEMRFGKSVHRGVAARVLQRGDELLTLAYATEPGPDADADGTPDWHVPLFDALGDPILLEEVVDCRPTEIACPCAGSAACVAFTRYLEIIAAMELALAIVEG